MEKVRRSLYTALAFVALSAVFSLASPAVAGGDKDVFVTNTAAHPVPVLATGTTNVAGAVTVSGAVSVTNTPTVDARQAGPWTVSLGGGTTVRIDNAATEPVPVRDVGAITHVPVMIHGTVEYGAVRSPVLYTVPAGKRLVVEHINVDGFLEADAEPWDTHTAFLASLIADQGGSVHQYALRLDPGPVFDSGRGSFEHFLIANTPVTFYFDAGTALSFFKSSASNASSRLSGAIAGYVVDAP